MIALVLGGLGSRLDLPVDRIDELALAAATLAPSVQADALELEADVLDDRLVVRIGLQRGDASLACESLSMYGRSTPIRRTGSSRCALAASDHVTTAPPSAVMNPRRCMCSLRKRLVQYQKPSTL